MALALPILLFVMALIVNFGTAACWKVRASSVAREMLWQTRFPRTGQTDPQPSYWPAPASATTAGLANDANLDDPRLEQNQAVARGPLPFGTQVNSQVLDQTAGFREGSAGITRVWPLLPKMIPMHLDAKTQMLDDRWQFQQMGMWSNEQRRIPVLYVLPKVPDMGATYVQVIFAILNAPFRPQLKPLDQDDEFLFYSQLFDWGSGTPSFYPTLPSDPPCYPDQQSAENDVQNLIDRIQGRKDPHVVGVPEAMTLAFIGLYTRAENAYQNEMNAVPPPSPAQQAAIQASINQLQSKIDALNQFLGTLP